MRTGDVTLADLGDLFAVPPLARNADRTIDFEENGRIVRHLRSAAVTRLLYGGNAHLHHIAMEEYERLLDWLNGQPDDCWMIPSAGASFGRAMDQARLLRAYDFPCVMMLPCRDPRDAAGLERGLREFAEAARTKLVVYLKEEDDFGPDLLKGLDAVARLVEDGVCVAIKYAIVREDPNDDPFLQMLLDRVDRRRILSGLGERPAVAHLRDWNLAGFTTGSGCIQPRLCRGLLDACRAGDYETAESLRMQFLTFEDVRDRWGPSRVLHTAIELCGIARTGPIPPFLSDLTPAQRAEVALTAVALLNAHLPVRAGEAKSGGA